MATSEVSHGGAIGGVGSALLVLVPARRPWYKKKGGEGPGCFRIHAHTRARAWLCIENAGNTGTPVPVNTRAEAWFTHIGNLGNAGTAFRCRDGYIEPVNAGQGPVASGSANAFSARGV